MRVRVSSRGTRRVYVSAGRHSQSPANYRRVVLCCRRVPSLRNPFALPPPRSFSPVRAPRARRSPVRLHPVHRYGRPPVVFYALFARARPARPVVPRRIIPRDAISEIKRLRRHHSSYRSTRGLERARASPPISETPRRSVTVDGHRDDVRFLSNFLFEFRIRVGRG